MALWDLWLDYHRREADGLTHGKSRNVRPGSTLAPGAHIIVGNEEADSAVAEIVSIDDDGVVLLRVLPGTVEDNQALLRPLSNRT
jgi:hypothetical protein